MPNVALEQHIQQPHLHLQHINDVNSVIEIAQQQQAGSGVGTRGLDDAPIKPALKSVQSLQNEFKLKRNISWQDYEGGELTQVVEYEPSEHEESDMGDGGERQACCVIS